MNLLKNKNIHQIYSYYKEDKSAYLLLIFSSLVIGGCEFITAILIPILIGKFSGKDFNSISNSGIFLEYLDSTQIFYIFIFLFLSQILLQVTSQIYFVGRIKIWRTMLSLRYVQALMNSSLKNIVNIDLGKIELVITRNIAAGMKIRFRAASYLSDALLAFIYFLISAYISKITIVLFAVVFFIYFFINHFSLAARIRLTKIALQQYEKISKKLVEYFLDPRSLLSYKTENILSTLKPMFDEAGKSQKETDIINIFLRNIHQPIILVMVVITLYVSRLVFNVAVSDILAIVYIFYRAAPKIIELGRGYGEIITEAPADIIPQILSMEKSARADIARPKLKFDNYDVNFQNLRFRYGEKVIIENANLSFRVGEVVAITGKSGCGKSSILDLLCGYAEPSSGQIMVGNKVTNNFDYRDFVQNNFALLRQESNLIDGSLEDNVVFLSEKLEKDFVRELLTKVGILKQDSLDPSQIPVTTQGDNYSAGQRQRIIIARALYKKPKFLLLDEPTSNLDERTAKDIMQVLLDIREGITIIICTHNLEIANMADRVIKIDGGLII